jgi:N-acetylglucosaminyldiphosphoundecaprenol N-acetyl-beta-D-mannosaminyltransferase
MDTYRLLGVKVNSLTDEEANKYALELGESGKPRYIVLLDTFLLMRAQFSRRLKHHINNAGLVIPISPGIRGGLKFMGHSIEKVFNYFSLTIRLLTHFTEHKKFIYMLGGRRKDIDTIDKNIRDSFPGIRLVGRYHGNYKKKFEKDLLTAMHKACPALILVSLKRPKQEEWIMQKYSSFKEGVFIGVDNFLNITAGREPSPAEKSIQSGTYGFSRFLKNPFRGFRLWLYLLYLIYLLIYKIGKFD